MMQVTEIFRSIQGESSWAGLPCTFIRLTGCPLRCRWCDTVYSFKGGEASTIDEILVKVKAFGVKLVEVTGGEPLAQAETPALISRLIAEGYEVLIETSGSEPIAGIDPKAHIIMDIKCPGSGMHERMHWANIDTLKSDDEVKFVIASRSDYDWAKSIIDEYQLVRKVSLLFSPAFGLLKPEDLVNWILEDGLDCRLNMQLHKIIWSPRKRGV